jgi:hypothetical protein
MIIFFFFIYYASCIFTLYVFNASSQGKYYGLYNISNKEDQVMLNRRGINVLSKKIHHIA